MADSAASLDDVLEAVREGLILDAYVSLVHGRVFFSARCECGRENCATVGHTEVLELAGWRRMPHKNAGYEKVGCLRWLCPFCAGTEAQLRAVFEQADD